MNSETALQGKFIGRGHAIRLAQAKWIMAGEKSYVPIKAIVTPNRAKKIPVVWLAMRTKTALRCLRHVSSLLRSAPRVCPPPQSIPIEPYAMPPPMSDPLTATQPAISTTSDLPVSSMNTPARPLTSSPAEYWHFISAFLRRPLTVGAVAPSSPALARAMVPPNDLKSAQIVVELGAGTGAITQAIQHRIAHTTELAVFELHPGAVECLCKKFAGIHVIHDTAENLRPHLDRLGHNHADCIVSGLPWSMMSDPLQSRILDAVLATLHPQGVFSVMVYLHSKWLPSSTKFKRKLEARFGRITASPIVWGNLPPAFVYYCEEPKQPAVVGS